MLAYIEKVDEKMIFANISLDDFAIELRHKKIVCFGAGRALLTFLRGLREFDVASKIAWVVDNDPVKQGTVCHCEGFDVPIVSPRQLKSKNFGNEYLLVITNLDVAPILQQLNNFPELEKTLCYSYRYLVEDNAFRRARSVSLPNSFRIVDRPLIPKVIHYCWFGRNPIPEQYKQWMGSWQRYCPDYEIVQWNEDNYDVAKHPYIRQAYEAGKWAFVSDYARLDIVYTHGGIYLDTDVEVLRNLDDLLYQPGFCGVDYNSLLVSTGLGVGARQGLPVLRELRDQYDTISFRNSDGTLNLTPCPVYQTAKLQQHGLQLSGEFQNIDGLMICPVIVLCGTSGTTGGDYATDRTYLRHHFAGSWTDEERKRKLSVLSKRYSELSSEEELF